MAIIWLNLAGFMLFNVICYSIIPYFVQRSGATLLNISNVTTIIWSMLSDILLFGEKFYPLYVVAFTLELTGVVIFSLRRPRSQDDEQAIKDAIQLT